MKSNATPETGANRLWVKEETLDEPGCNEKLAPRRCNSKTTHRFDGRAISDA